MTKAQKIFYFDTYRSWLSAEINLRIEKNPQFSVNAFAAKAKMSQSLLSLILSKKRKLTLEKAETLSDYLELTPEERNYLRLLIQFDQGKNPKERNVIKRDIEELAKQLITAEEHRDSARPFNAWQYNALLAATDLSGIQRTVEGLAGHLGYSVDKVREGLNLLVNIGLIREGEGIFTFCPEGEGRLTESVVRQSNWKIAKSILEQALFKFEDNHLQFDTIQGRIVASNPEQIMLANERIKAFSKELEDILRTGERSTLVQFSFQLFDV